MRGPHAIAVADTNGDRHRLARSDTDAAGTAYSDARRSNHPATDAGSRVRVDARGSYANQRTNSQSDSGGLT